MAKEEKEKRIDDIINAAVDEFIEKGYEKATMESIAQRAGFSKGGLYHHFKSKEEILFYANDKLCEPLDFFMSKTGEFERADDALMFYIINYLSFWKNHMKEAVFYLLVVTKAISSEKLWKSYEESLDEHRNSLEVLFNEGVKQKIFKEHDTRMSAYMLASSLDGILSFIFIDKSLSVEYAFKMFEEKFINSVKI